MSLVRKFFWVIVGVSLFYVSTEFLVRRRLDLVDVIVAKRDITQREKIENNDLQTIKISRHMVEEDTIKSINDLIGKYVKMQHTLLKGQIIRQANIESLEDAIDAPSLLLYKHERVFALKKDVVGTLGSSLQTGSIVDIAIQKKKDSEYGIIVPSVRIVGVRDRYGEEVSSGKTPHVILLALHIDDINRVLKAEEEGKLVLLARNIHDD